MEQRATARQQGMLTRKAGQHLLEGGPRRPVSLAPDSSETKVTGKGWTHVWQLLGVGGPELVEERPVLSTFYSSLIFGEFQAASHMSDCYSSSLNLCEHQLQNWIGIYKPPMLF